MKKTPTQRRSEILNHLKQGLVSSPAELAKLFGVSVMTIHRDLKQLDAEGYLSKQHGEAVINPQSVLSSDLEKRTNQNANAKQAIGQFVAENLIDKESDSLVIDSGSTTLALVKALPDIPINVMVNSLLASNILAEHKQTKAYSVGGRLNHTTLSFEGSMAFDMLSQCHFTKAFLGADGIDLSIGLTTSNTANAQLTRLMAQQAESVYVLMDASKFNHRALATVMGFDGITGIVTEAGVPNEYRVLFDEYEIELFEVAV